jgi:hypothetical protein
MPEADLAEKRRLAADFKNAVVREISYDEAKNLCDTTSPEFDYTLGELSNSVPDAVHVV